MSQNDIPHDIDPDDYTENATQYQEAVLGKMIGWAEEHGEVVTYRERERTTGETWWRKSRTGEKMGDVVVEEIGPCNPARPIELFDYRRLSGFESAGKWQDAIIELHDGDLPHSGFLYRVTARNDSFEADGGDDA